jgi:hypothetical protein
LHLDASAGMAGNMFMGALLDAGLSLEALEAGLSPLPFDFELKVGRVRRGGFAACHVEVVVPARATGGRSRSASRAGARKRAVAHGHAHDEHHLAADGHGRRYLEIVEMLEASALAAPVRVRALEVFESLARAEARVHGRKLDRVHFHEVGMIDAIVDVTAAALGLELLDVDRVTCSPVGIGHGFVETAHGRLPIPAPATLALLEGVPTVPLDVAWETITPTGAALVRTLVDEFLPWPELTVDAVGYGAGRERPGATPNLVRVVLGRADASLSRDRVAVIETNLDDLVPEHFEYLLERLMESGALDVSVQHVVMKKNRPGFLLRVLCAPSRRDTLARVLFAESTAIGLRHQEWDRLLLERRSIEVATDFGRVRVKEIVGPSGDVSFSAEYDDCKRAARRFEVQLRSVVEAAETAARERLRDELAARPPAAENHAATKPVARNSGAGKSAATKPVPKRSRGKKAGTKKPVAKKSRRKGAP